MRAALVIAGKDLRERLRDRSALMMAVVLPLTLAFIYNLIFGSAAAPRAFEYAVVDLDGGQVAQVFVTDVLAEAEKQGYVTLRRLNGVAEAERLAGEGAIDAAFVLPAGFSAAVGSAAPAAMDVIGNVDSPTGTDVARSIARSYAAELDAGRLAVAAVLAGRDQAAIPPEEIAAVAHRAAVSSRPVLLRDVSADERILDVKTYFAAGMAVFFLFFTVQFGVSSLLDERNQGTLSRLLAAPIAPAAILAGKLITSVVLGLASMAVLVAATTVLMGAAWGDPLGVAALVLAGVLAATGITAVVASLARNADQAGGWQAVIAVVLGLLGGAFFPISQVGGFTAALSLVTPHAWFLRGLAELAGGGTIRSTLPSVAAMLAFAVLTGGVALFRLSKVVRS
jgi:ABC-2 type transport system permease protein